MNKVILITGAGTGIGAETARQLAEGNTLFLHYNQSAEAVKQVAEDDTRLKITVRADLNPFLKPMVSKPLQEAVDKISTVIASLPY